MSHFSDESLAKILQNFNSISTQDGQDAYLYALISSTPTQCRHRKEGSREQSYQYHYKVKLGEEEHVVCHEGFASLHGVGVKRI